MSWTLDPTEECCEECGAPSIKPVCDDCVREYRAELMSDIDRDER